jgi:hypothetical protein
LKEGVVLLKNRGADEGFAGAVADADDGSDVIGDGEGE